MLNRVLTTALRARAAPLIAKRAVHKGTEGTPPMRYISIPQKIAFYFFIAGTFMSYPTYVLLNLNNFRPAGENSLGDEAQAELERRRGAK